MDGWMGGFAGNLNPSQSDYAPKRRKGGLPEDDCWDNHFNVLFIPVHKYGTVRNVNNKVVRITIIEPVLAIVDQSRSLKHSSREH